MTPDFMPTLSAGAHDAGDGEACVMEYVSLLAGEQWSDRPDCTHPLLAHEARVVNDLLLDDDRPRLVPLIGRLFGTTEDSPAVRAALRLAQARQVRQLIEPSSRVEVDSAIALAESGCTTPGPGPVRVSSDDPHALVHVSTARMIAFGTGEESVEWPAAWALQKAHLVAASECRADCADDAARARRQVLDIAAMIDAYDRVTGRATTPLAPAQVRELAAQLG